MLSGADAHAAHVMASRMREAVAAAPRGLPAITASVGIAEHCPGKTGDDLLKRADRALYDAKDAGRDRISVAG